MKQLENLKSLLGFLDKQTNKPLTVFEHFVLNKDNLDNKLSIRVDVDNGLVCAERLAYEFNKRDIRASFYFLTLTAPYNIFNDCIKNIHAMGHEVGLHTDHLYLNKQFGIDSLLLLKNDINILSTLIGEPIKGMCFHGNGKFEPYHNWTLYREMLPESLELKYHDGYTSSYCKQSSKYTWFPPVINYLSDDPNGWLDSIDELKSFFSKVEQGQSSHLIIHPQYFFNPNSWLFSPYHEQSIPLPKIKKNKMVKLNKGIKFIFDKVFIIFEIVIRFILYGIMNIIGNKKNSGVLHEFALSDFITQTYSEPNNYEIIVQNLKLNKNDIVLDVGFGAGQFLFLIAKQAEKIYGVEPASDLYDFVNNKIANENLLNIFISKDCGEQLNFENDFFDKAVCMSVLMMTNPYKVLKEIRRVLKRGGLLTMHISDIGYSLHSLRDGIYCKNPNRIKGTLKQLIQRFRRSILRQYNTGGVFTQKDIEKLSEITGFEIIENLNQGYYDWEPKKYWGFNTQHLITLRKK